MDKKKPSDFSDADFTRKAAQSLFSDDDDLFGADEPPVASAATAAKRTESDQDNAFQFVQDKDGEYTIQPPKRRPERAPRTTPRTDEGWNVSDFEDEAEASPLLRVLVIAVGVLVLAILIFLLITVVSLNRRVASAESERDIYRQSDANQLAILNESLRRQIDDMNETIRELSLQVDDYRNRPVYVPQPPQPPPYVPQLPPPPPPAPLYVIHIVASGETFGGILQMHYGRNPWTFNDIQHVTNFNLTFNPGFNAAALVPGQSIRIPLLD